MTPFGTKIKTKIKSYCILPVPHAFFGGCHGVGQRNVVVHEIDDGCGKFTHIGFYKVRLCGNLGGR